MSYTITEVLDHGSIVQLVLAPQDGGPIRIVSGDHRPMGDLLESWIEEGRPPVDVSEDGLSISLLT